ncbi:MAG TPA: hypothetical protein VFU37_09510 [Pyrinomonadaceae bacterium]|nr:hypothetical protein [Pyrinomonadaceae bacterium]
MKIIIASLLIAAAAVVALGQAPTLQIVTADPNLPSELFYGSVKIKPLRVRPGTNPPQFITIDDSDFFTQEQYIDFLTRMPDQSGFQFWLGQITGCGQNNPGCTEVMRINVSASFFLSIEFKETGYLAERTYKSAFGDATGVSTLNGTHNIIAPYIRFGDFQTDVKQLNNGLIVLQPGWETVLENNKVAYFNAFVQRSSFTSKYPNSTTPAQFVDLLFNNTGITPSASERSAAINEFGGASDISNVMARAKALRDVAENATLATAEFNRAFVLMQYFGYLRRDPNSGQDTDYTGFDFWLIKLNQFNGNYINAEMVKAFISSIEYRNRF